MMIGAMIIWISLHKAVTQRPDPIVLGELGKEPTDKSTKSDGDEHLNIKNSVPRL